MTVRLPGCFERKQLLYAYSTARKFGHVFSKAGEEWPQHREPASFTATTARTAAPTPDAQSTLGTCIQSHGESTHEVAEDTRLRRLPLSPEAQPKFELMVFWQSGLRRPSVLVAGRQVSALATEPHRMLRSDGLQEWFGFVRSATSFESSARLPPLTLRTSCLL